MEGVRLAGLETEAPIWCVGGVGDASHCGAASPPSRGLAAPCCCSPSSELPFPPGDGPDGVSELWVCCYPCAPADRGKPCGKAALCARESPCCCFLLLLCPHSFPDFFPRFHVKKGKPKRSQNHLPPWLKVQIEVLLFYLKKQACSVLEYHCGVFMRETGSTKPHFSPQHRQKMTERDLGPPLSVEGDC